MYDAIIAALDKRIEALHARLGELERWRQSERDGLVGRFGRIGIVVGLIGGIVGTLAGLASVVSIVLDKWQDVSATAAIQPDGAPELTIQYDPSTHSGSFNWGVLVSNEGRKRGEIKWARARLISFPPTLLDASPKRPAFSASG